MSWPILWPISMESPKDCKYNKIKDLSRWFWIGASLLILKDLATLRGLHLYEKRQGGVGLVAFSVRCRFGGNLIIAHAAW